MSDNRKIIEKADMTLADLASGGRLQPEQADVFTRRLIDAPTLISQVRRVVLTSPEMNINRIMMGNRILRKAVSATALADADRVKPDLSQIQISTKEVIAEVQLPYDVIEDIIERSSKTAAPMQTPPGGFHQTIVELIAERAALDLEELALKGDTALAGSDDYLGLFDGWLKRATQNVVNANGQTISKNVLKAGVKAMPVRYKRNLPALKHLLSWNNETELRDLYATRQTAEGDGKLTGTTPVMLFGTKVEPATLMPETTGLFTDPKNLIFAVHRDVQIEYDKDIRRRVFVIVLTCRVGVQIEEENAIVKYTNIAAS